MKEMGMLVVSLGSNHRFWSHLGCSGENAHIFNCQGITHTHKKPSFFFFFFFVFCFSEDTLFYLQYKEIQNNI